MKVIFFFQGDGLTFGQAKITLDKANSRWRVDLVKSQRYFYLPLDISLIRVAIVLAEVGA